MSADAHHMSAPREDGEGVRLAIEKALREAGISPSDVGYVNTHGTSTPLGDVAECSALEKVFGVRDSLKVNSSKCMIGHALGAAGALEAIITVKSLQNQMVHATTSSTPCPTASALAARTACCSWPATSSFFLSLLA